MTEQLERHTMPLDAVVKRFRSHHRTVLMVVNCGHLSYRKVTHPPVTRTHRGYGVMGWSTHSWTETPTDYFFDPEEVEAFADQFDAVVVDIAIGNHKRMEQVVSDWVKLVHGVPKEKPSPEEVR